MIPSHSTRAGAQSHCYLSPTKSKERLRQNLILIVREWFFIPYGSLGGLEYSNVLVAYQSISYTRCRLFSQVNNGCFHDDVCPCIAKITGDPENSRLNRMRAYATLCDTERSLSILASSNAEVMSYVQSSIILTQLQKKKTMEKCRCL